MEAPPHHQIKDFNFILFFVFIKGDNWKMPKSPPQKLWLKKNGICFLLTLLKFLKSLRVTNNRKSHLDEADEKLLFLCGNLALSSTIPPYFTHKHSTFDKDIKKRFLRMTDPFGYMLKRKTCLRETLIEL